jgi:hypothetical protein
MLPFPEVEVKGCGNERSLTIVFSSSEGDLTRISEVVLASDCGDFSDWRGTIGPIFWRFAGGTGLAASLSCGTALTSDIGRLETGLRT